MSQRKKPGLFPNRDAVTELSHEERVALDFRPYDELEERDKPNEALRQALEARRVGYEQRLETQRIEYEARLEDMRHRVNALLRKLNTNSTNSGIPPSKAPVGFDRSADKADKDGNGKAAPPTTGNKRSRGGQKGHKGSGTHFIARTKSKTSRRRPSDAVRLWLQRVCG